MSTHSQSNGEKNKAGRNLKDQLVDSFDELIEQNIIIGFKSEENFNHKGFSYNQQYLINFIIETLDNKFILINSSTSFRNDRFKQQAYDIDGALNNSIISADVTASIMLYPDSEIENSTFLRFRERIKKGKSFSPTQNLFTLSEFYEFLENHKASVEEQKNETEESDESVQVKDGSYYGKAGNELEKEVVKFLNNKEYLEQYKSDTCKEILFTSILDQLCNQAFNKENIITIKSTNTVEKLAKGGNAKTDVIIKIILNDGAEIIETLSIKKSSKTVVSCHDYKYEDFVRVLDIKGTKLEKYFKIFQANPTYESFEKELPDGFTIIEFEKNLKPYIEKFAQWVLTGEHDNLNLTNPIKQVSRFLLVVTNNQVFCSDYNSYIEKIFKKSLLKYGLPFRWTYPSKQRGKRIQLKMPIVI